MTTRKERIEKAERAVIEAVKATILPVTSAVEVAAAALRKAEASGPPGDLDRMVEDDAAAHVLKALAKEPDFSRELALEWAEELEER